MSSRWIARSAIAAALLAGGVAIGLALTGGGGGKTAACPAKAKLDGVWDGPRRHAVAAAFERSAMSYAPTVARDVERALDAYAATLGEGERAVCADRRRGVMTELERLRRACLTRRRAELAAMVDELTRVDDRGVPRAPRAVSRLTPVAECADAEQLRRDSHLPDDETHARTVAELVAGLDRALVQIHLGRGAEIVGELEALAARAHALGHRPTEAEAEYLFGSALEAADKIADAERHFRDALVLAQGAHHDALVTRAAALLALNVGRLQKRPAEGQTWAELAIATSARLGRPPQLETIAHMAAAIVANGDRRFDDAEREALLALEAATAAGQDAVQRAEIINTLGGVALGRGRFEDAGKRYTEARALSAAALGDDHPSMIVYDSNLGSVASALGDFDRAVEYRRRVLAARERTLGPTTPRVGDAHVMLAQVLGSAGQHDEAVTEARRGLEIVVSTGGATTPSALGARATLAAALQGAGQLDEATAIATALETDALAAGPPGAMYRTSALALLGDLALDRRRPADAAAFFRRALDAAAAAGDTASSGLGVAMRGLAHTTRLAGDRGAAFDLARRARAILTISDGPGARETARAAEEETLSRP